MTRCRAGLTGLFSLMLALGAVLAASPAAAGGPTSVLLADPGSGRTAALYYSDTKYGELQQLVGRAPSTGATEGAEAHAVGRSISLTWLIHDVSVWRVDRIYPDAPGGPWIATQELLGESTNIWDTPVRWRQPRESKALFALLDRIGVGTGSGVDTGIGTAAGSEPDAAADAPVPEASAQSGPAADAARSDSRANGTGVAGWVWGLIGLALGGALTGCAVLLVSRRREQLDHPAQSSSTDASSVGSAEPDWVLRDELSSAR